MSLVGCGVGKIIKEGDALLEVNRAAEATSNYELALAKDPKLARKTDFVAKLNRARALAAYQDGVRLGGQGDWEAAVQAFQRSLDVGPEVADAPRALAEAKREAAKVCHQRALGLADQGKLNQAILELRRALSLDPENLDAQDALKSVEDRKQDLQSRAHKLYGDALALQAEKRWLKASETLDAALEANRNHLPSRVKLHTSEENLSRARKLYSTGNRQLEERRLDAAITSYESALAVWPFFDDARRELAESCRRREVAQGHLDRAKALAERGEWDETVRATQAALGVFPFLEEAKALLNRSKQEAAAAHLVTGQGLLAAGKLAEAEAEFKLALGYVPDLAGAKSGLAQADATRGEVARQQGLWGHALLWYMNADEHVSRPAYRDRVKEARSAIVGRIRFAVAIGAAAGEPDTGALVSRVAQRVARGKPVFVNLTDGPADYTARVGVSRLDIAERRTASENRVHEYTIRQEVVNPELADLQRDLGRVRMELRRMVRQYHEKCHYCRGTGRVTCPKCNGTASLPCATCGATGQVACATCGGTGAVGGAPCGTCGGTGKVGCPTCGGTGQIYCNACSTDAIRNGWIKCPVCKGYGNKARIRQKHIDLKRSEVDSAAWRLRSAPATVIVDVPAQWPYVVETFEKSATMVASIQVTETAGGTVVHCDTVRRQSSNTDQATQTANPAVGLAADPLVLPSDDDIRRALLAAIESDVASRVAAAVVQARVSRAQARAAQLSREGKDVEAVEANVDAALLVEALNSGEASRVLNELRRAK